MFPFLLILLILDGLLMTVIVLLQSGKGGGLAAMGGGGGGSTMADQLIGGRQAATLLTKATWITGGLFLGLSIVLSIMSSNAAAPSSVLEQEFSQPRPILQQPAVPPAGDAGATPGIPGTEPVPATGVPPTTTSGN